MLASVIREIIAPVLRECPPACGIVSITEIEVARGYGHVKVSVSALRELETALAFLESRKKELRGMLASKLSLRSVPTIGFRMDLSGERGDRIDRLLQGDDMTSR